MPLITSGLLPDVVVKAQYRGGFSLGQPEDFPRGVVGGGGGLGLKLNSAQKMNLKYSDSLKKCIILSRM